MTGYDLEDDRTLYRESLALSATVGENNVEQRGMSAIVKEKDLQFGVEFYTTRFV